MPKTADTVVHPFLNRPHRTLLGLSFPVLLSLVAEPLTGLVDTAFIARLGAVPLASLGVGTVTLSSIFWIFYFLDIGTQTSVSHAHGRQDPLPAARLGCLAICMGVIGLLVAELNRPGGLTRIWIITALWIIIRALPGILRIWPGIGRAPLGSE